MSCIEIYPFFSCVLLRCEAANDADPPACRHTIFLQIECEYRKN